MNREVLRILALILIIVGVFIFLNKQPVNNSQQKQCNATPTPSLTEGPYYKSNSPLRTNLIEGGVIGEKITITGYVYDINCNPISGALLDFWQADGNGIYDNSGYKLRGHQFTDKDGKYILETVIPGEYPGRTPHIHLKIMANDKSPIVTSQLFFPDKSQNQRDNIFDSRLIMKIKDTPEGKQAKYNFAISN